MAHPPQRSPALLLALGAHLVLAVAFVRAPGVVGEVDLVWGLADPPRVLVDAEGPVYAAPGPDAHAGHRLGGRGVALDAAQVRPVSSLVLGPRPDGTSRLRLPLAVNQYTGGLPDWPSRLLVAATGRHGPARALHVVYGLLLVAFVWRIARRHQAVVAAGAAALWLATDWSFLYYRQVLGGTEAWLVGASLLLVRALWDRRWAGGGMAAWGLALAVGAGLHAKITFVALLAAAVVASLATRWDRGPLGVPVPVRARALLGAGALLAALLAPLALADLHHAIAVPDTPHLRSHDFLGPQLRRLTEGLAHLGDPIGVPAREQPANLRDFLLRPLASFERSCGADPVGGVDLGRLLGWLILLAGSALAWTDRHARAPDALLRWLSLAVPTASLLLFLLNRDLHHQAVLTGWIALWGGLSVDRVAALVSPPRSPARARTCLLLLLPWMGSGALAAAGTDAVLATCRTPVILASGQAAVVDRLRAHAVERLVTLDYDSYGTLDLLAPQIRVTHGWGATSRAESREDTAVSLLRVARGGHLLLLRPSAPTIYAFDPPDDTLAVLARRAAVHVREIDRLEDAHGPWARLYVIEDVRDRPRSPESTPR